MAETVHDVADRLSRDLAVTVIELWPRDVHECMLCGEVKQCRHCVAFYCEPTYDEIGSVSTQYRSTDGKPAIVGGMVCCKECHDEHEAKRPNAT
jgi:hypothetical protein